MEYTKEVLEQYLRQQEERLKDTASAWMKAEVRKSIEMAAAELTKLDREKTQ